MSKQTIPMGGFEGSAAGALHESSKGPWYPWTVQPRVERTRILEDGKMPREEMRTVWVAFNALTGFEGPRMNRYEEAERSMILRRWLEAEDVDAMYEGA